MITQKEIDLLNKIIKIFSYNQKLMSLLEQKDSNKQTSIYKSVFIMNSMYQQIFQDLGVEVILPTIGERFNMSYHFPKEVLPESKGIDLEILKIKEVFKPGIRTILGDCLIKADVKV